MALALVISDAADGTGGTATVSGSDGGTTNRLYAASFAGGPIGPQSWTLVDSRVGDGNISIASPGTLALGFYVWMLTGTVSSTAAFASYYRNLTDASAQSVWDRSLDAMVQQIQALNLADVVSVNVVRRWLPRFLKDVDAVPAVIVAPVNSENFPAIFTNTDNIGYPIAVVYVAKQNQDYTANQARNMLWRQRVSRIFRFQKLAGVAESVIVRPENGIIIDPAAFDANLFSGYQIFRCEMRESRGAASV